MCRQTVKARRCAPVVAEFLVVDSTGQMVSARSHLPFVLERRTNVVNPNSTVTHDRGATYASKR